MARNFVTIIKEICREEGINLTSVSWDWIFTLEKDGKKAKIIGHVFGLNSASVHDICCDKGAASSLLTACGVPNVEHTYFMAPIDRAYAPVGGSWRELLALLDKYGALVVKDNGGTGGNLVFRVRDEYELENALYRVFLKKDAAAVSPLLSIENEYRCVYLDGRVRLAFNKERPFVAGDGVSPVSVLAAPQLEKAPALTEELAAGGWEPDYVPAAGEKVELGWKHNLGKGSTGVVVTDSALLSQLEALVHKAADSLGVRFASVDVVRVGGELMILEVNSGVMMEHFSGEGPEEYAIAKSIYKDAILAMLA